MKYPIKSEQLQHAISIQKQSITHDDYGEVVDTWENIATNIHAFVDPTSGSEFYAAQRINAEANYNVWIRYRPGLNNGIRVMYGNKTLEVVSPPIDLFESHVWIRLVCKEII